MSIAGHVSRAMLSRYSHVRMEAKRRALDEIAARQRAADEKRKERSEGKRSVLGRCLNPQWFSDRNLHRPSLSSIALTADEPSPRPHL